VDTTTIVLYRDYVKFAVGLEKQLQAIYGHKKATKLYQRMDQSRFQAICEAAPSDALKRQWLRRLQENCTRILGGDKAGKAA
jgi:hypothetical protein